jgi:hypothetical protein
MVDAHRDTALEELCTFYTGRLAELSYDRADPGLGRP